MGNNDLKRHRGSSTPTGEGWVSGQRFPIIIWLFPLALLIGVGVVWFAGGSAMTEDFVRDQLAASYGLSETQLER